MNKLLIFTLLSPVMCACPNPNEFEAGGLDPSLWANIDWKVEYWLEKGYNKYFEIDTPFTEYGGCEVTVNLFALDPSIYDPYSAKNAQEAVANINTEGFPTYTK